jgi:TetR/AcrR family transcriptional repressor of mexCD-oprJ operon
MDHPSTEEALLKALAVALVDYPRGTLKDIAQAAGVSKATLGRHFGTREKLVEMLLDHGTGVINRILTILNTESAPVEDVFRPLIESHFAHREFVAFLTHQWHIDSMNGSGGVIRWQPYRDGIDAFFLRGQRSGVFRIDLGAPVLTELFTSTIAGLVDAERRGRLGRAGMAAQLEQFFLFGASVR